MAPKPGISIIGPGRLGAALALELSRAGFTITDLVSRDRPASWRKANRLARRLRSRVVSFKSGAIRGAVIWLCVPDREIPSVVRQLAPLVNWKGKTVFHSSGALTSDELGQLRDRGATVASVHPLMTFVARSAPALRDVPFGIEGDSAAIHVAQRIVRDLGGEVFRVQKAMKAAYHVWGMFASPLLLATLVTAEQAARQAGISAASARRKMLAIVRQTVANYAALGPAAAFSGPIVRGDVETVRKHVAILKGNTEVYDVYSALARAALRYLPARNRGKLTKALG